MPKGHRDLITPNDFRRPGDAPLSRLQRFFDALGRGVDAALDANYVIPSQLVIDSRSGFTLRGNGHRIKLSDGAPTGWGGSAIYMAHCTDFQIVDLICDGNRAQRKVSEDPAHVIVVDKCHRWTFRNVQAVNGTCDGFFISAGAHKAGSGPNGAVSLDDCPSNWKMERCVALNNYRQGASIIESIGGLISGGRYGLTDGILDDGSGPGAGIDLEPDDQPSWPPNRIRNIRIHDVLFDRNQGPGLLITRVNGVQNIEVSDCTFDRNQKAAIESVGDDVAILRPRVKGWSGAAYTRRASAPPKRGAIDIGYQAGPTKIVDPEFQATSRSGTTANPCIYVHGGAAANITITGIKSDGSASIICAAHSPHVRVSHSVIDLRNATQQDAFTFLGDYPVFEEMMLLGVYRRAAYFGGKSPRITNNKFYIRASDQQSSVISAWDAKSPEFRANLVEYETRDASIVFGIGPDAVVIDNIVINNGNPAAFAFTAAPRLSSGNQMLKARPVP